MSKKRNPLKVDPSRTVTLRRMFVAELMRRFNRVRRKVIKLIVEENAFGLEPVRNEENERELQIRSVNDSSNFAADLLFHKTPMGRGVENDTQTVQQDRDIYTDSNDDPIWYSSTNSRSNDSPRTMETNNLVNFLKEDEKDDPSSNVRSDEDIPMDGSVRNNSSRKPDNVGYTKVFGVEATIINQRFAFKSTARQVDAFQKWLATQIKVDIVSQQMQDKYWERFTEEGYKKGAGRAFDDTRKAVLTTKAGASVSDFYAGTRAEFLRSSFGRPVAINKVKLLAGRTFTDLKNVTDVMATQIRRELTDGLVRGDNPRVIAKNITDRIDKIGKTRAEQLARTEIIRVHAEGQLDAMEALGVEEVGVMVEWSTAGDDRVCFPAWTKVLTENGLVPIQKIKPGMRVKTRQGYQKVTTTFKRNHPGIFTKIKTDQGSITSTGDHPFWTLKNDWIKAQDLTTEDLLYSPTDKLIKILSLVNFNLSYPAYLPAFFGKVPIFSFVFSGVLMPISTINFNSNSFIKEKEVNRVTPQISLLNERERQSRERQPNSFLNRCFPCKFSITGKATKSFRPITGTLAKPFSAIGTVNKDRGFSTFFRTMFSVKPPLFISSLIPKTSVASFTISPFPLSIFSFAGKRTIVVSVLNRLFYRKRITTTNTNLANGFSPASIITETTTKPSGIFFRPINQFITSRTRHFFTLFVTLHKTFMRAKTLYTLVFNYSMPSLKRLPAIITDKYKWHVYSFLSNLSLLYHKIKHKTIPVYDIQVENCPEFFANNILVHNCPRCIDMEGAVLKVKESHGLIPRHVQCITGDSIVECDDAFSLMKSHYTGEIIEIVTAHGCRLSATPNHILLTQYGLIPANFLYEGIEIVSTIGSKTNSIIAPNNNSRKACIADIFASFAKDPRMISETVPLAPEDLHGDGQFCNSEVNIIRPYRVLWEELVQQRLISFKKSEFPLFQFIDAETSLLAISHMTSFLKSMAFASDSSMGRFREFLSLLLGSLLHAKEHRLTSVPRLKSNILQSFVNSSTAATELFRKSLDAHPTLKQLNDFSIRQLYPVASGLSVDILSSLEINPSFFESTTNEIITNIELAGNDSSALTGKVSLDKIVSVNVVHVENLPVYDLQTYSTLYQVNGLIASNCRCAFIPANLGESQKGQIRGKPKLDKAIDDSLRHDLPKGRKIKGVEGRRFKDPKTGKFTVPAGKGKKSLADLKKTTKWQGADVKISKKRPKPLT